jgi:hypothetical protein
MQIMPELLESCGDVVMPPPVDEVKSGSHEISDLASPPSQALDFEKSVIVDAVVSLSPESYRQVVPSGVGIAKSRLSRTVPRVVVTREVCDFLAT